MPGVSRRDCNRLKVLARIAVLLSAYAAHPVSKDARWKRVRRGLGNLPQKGADHWWIREKTPALLELDLVSNKAAGLEVETWRREQALGEVLRETIHEFRHEPDGIVLIVVLALENPYIDHQQQEHSLLDLSVKDRRTLAGIEFRGGRSRVGPDAIRMSYEPAALDRLAVVLLRREAALNGVQINGGDHRPDDVLLYLPGEPVLDPGLYEVCDLDGHRLGRHAACALGDTFPATRDETLEYAWRSSVRQSES